MHRKIVLILSEPTTNLLEMHILTVTTNTASGGDFVSLNAFSCPDGWFFEISDSCGLDFVLPADILKEMPNEEGLINFINAIRLDGEPEFRGLVFGFLEMNYSKGKDLNKAQVADAHRFLELESRDFPSIAKKYQKLITKWLENWI